MVSGRDVQEFELHHHFKKYRARCASPAGSAAARPSLWLDPAGPAPLAAGGSSLAPSS